MPKMVKLDLGEKKKGGKTKKKEFRTLLKGKSLNERARILGADATGCGTRAERRRMLKDEVAARRRLLR